MELTCEWPFQSLMTSALHLRDPAGVGLAHNLLRPLHLIRHASLAPLTTIDAATGDLAIEEPNRRYLA